MTQLFEVENIKCRSCISSSIILSLLFVGISQLAAQMPQGMVKKTTKPVTVISVTETMKVLGNCGMCKKTSKKPA